MIKLAKSPFATTFIDWPSCDGHALVVYCAGCRWDCAGCHSPELQNVENGEDWRVGLLCKEIVFRMRKERTDRLIFSGGDPLLQAIQLREVIGQLKQLDPAIKVMVYTGYEHEWAKELVDGIDFIKTGRYDQNLKQQSGKTDFEMRLASTNQAIFNQSGVCLTVDGILKFKRD